MYYYPISSLLSPLYNVEHELHISRQRDLWEETTKKESLGFYPATNTYTVATDPSNAKLTTANTYEGALDVQCHFDRDASILDRVIAVFSGIRFALLALFNDSEGNTPYLDRARVSFTTVTEGIKNPKITFSLPRFDNKWKKFDALQPAQKQEILDLFGQDEAATISCYNSRKT